VTEATMAALILTMFLVLLVVGMHVVALHRKLRATRELLGQAVERHDKMMNLLGAAALTKGGTLTIPCREPNFKLPGLNIERKGNAYKVTVSGGPHL